MAITINTEGQFFDTEKNREMGIFAKQTKGGRWQYRIESHTGKLIAAGMDPAAFVKRYWMRDDFGA